MSKPPDDTPEPESRSPPRTAPSPHPYYDDDSTGYQPYSPDDEDDDTADDEKPD